MAIGDSSTEGLEDPDGRGGYRGWSRRLAERIAAAQGSLLYANLAVRGRRTREIRDAQLAPALGLKPDLATVFCGTNDVIAWRFDAPAFAADVEAMQGALRDAGATVLSFTLPDLSAVMPLARPLAGRVRAMNAALRQVSARTGTILLDFERHPVATDPRIWSGDRIHVNSEGHVRIAGALAEALGLPGAGTDWSNPLPPLPARGPAAAMVGEARWCLRHLVPWAAEAIAGRPGPGREPPSAVPLREVLIGAPPPVPAPRPAPGGPAVPGQGGAASPRL